MNNFDISSTGINIDVNIMLDDMMSQINFNENIKRVSINGKLQYVYVNHGNIEVDVNNLGNYEIVSVRGHSQGDIIKDEITNYFYDSPLIARVTINDEEYILEELDGYYIYDYNKEEVIKSLIHDTPKTINKDVLRVELDELLPCEI